MAHAFGAALLAGEREIVERDDGFISTSMLDGPWFDYLIVSPVEMAELVEGTGWRIRRLVQDDGSYYVAVLD